MRRALLVIVIAWLASSCGDGTSLADYAEELETLVATQNARLDQLDVDLDNTLTLDQVKYYARERIRARNELLVALEEIEPPDSVVDLHAEALDILGRLTDAETAMAVMVEGLESTEGIGGIWETPEGVAARQADARAILVCEAAQETFDRTAAGAEFEDVPWIPTEMKQVIRVAFGCRTEDRQP